MSSRDGEIILETSVDTTGFNTGIESMSGMAKKLAGVVAAAFSVAAVGNFISESLDGAKLVEQTQAQLGAVLRSTGMAAGVTAQAVNDYTDKMWRLTGIDDEALTSAQSMLLTFTAIGNNVFPKAMDSILDMSTAMNGGAIPSMEQLRGTAIQLGKALQSPDAGLGALGRVGVNVQELKAKFTGLMTTEEKQILILQELQNEFGGSAMAAGKTFGGQLAILQVTFGNLQESIGAIFIPLLMQIIPLLAQILQWITAWAATIAAVLSAIFGIQAGAAQSASNLAGAAGAARDLRDNITGAGSATDKAGKAAKGALASFDKLNVLQGAGDKAGGGGGGGAPISFPPVDVSGAMVPLETVSAEIEKLKTQFLTFLQPLIDAWARLQTSVAPLQATLWAGLQWLWTNILVPFGTWVMQETIPAFLDLLGASGGTLNSALVALQPAAMNFWNMFLQPLATWAGTEFIKLLKDLTDKIKDLGAWIDKNPEQFRTFAADVVLFLGAWQVAKVTTGIALIADALIQMTAAMIPNIAAWWASVSAKAADTAAMLTSASTSAGVWISSLLTSTAAIWSQVTAWAANSAATLVANAQMWLMNAATTAWNVISGIAAGLTWAFGAAVAFLTSPIGLVILAVIALIAIIAALIIYWPQVSAFALQTWTTIQQMWAIAAWWFDNNVLKPIKKGFEGAWKFISDGFKNAFDTVAGTVKGIVNTIIDLINGMLSGMANGINGMINGANLMGSILPGWVNIPNVTAPSIPHLATGAVIPPNSQFLAVLGDQKSGRNIEAPEGLIRQIVREEMGNQKVTVEFTGTLAALARALAPEIKLEHIRSGGDA